MASSHAPSSYQFLFIGLYILLPLLITFAALASADIRLDIVERSSNVWDGNCSATCDATPCQLVVSAPLEVFHPTSGECNIEVVSVALPDEHLMINWIFASSVTKVNLTLPDGKLDLSSSVLIFNQPASISTKTINGALTGKEVNFTIGAPDSPLTIQNTTLLNFSALIDVINHPTIAIAPHLIIKGCLISTKLPLWQTGSHWVAIHSSNILSEDPGIIHIIESQFSMDILSSSWVAIDSKVEKLVLKIESVSTHDQNMKSEFGKAFLVSNGDKVEVSILKSHLKMSVTNFMSIGGGEAHLKIFEDSSLRNFALIARATVSGDPFNLTLYGKAFIGGMDLSGATAWLHDESAVLNCHWSLTSQDSITLVNGTSYGVFTNDILPAPGATSAWTLNGAKMLFENGAKFIFFDNSSRVVESLVFDGIAFIGDPNHIERRCEFETTHMKIDSDVNTFCNISLPSGAVGGQPHSLAAVVSNDRVTLTLNDTATYDIALDFANFETVIFNVHPGNDNNTGIRGSDPSLLEISNLPKNTRIIWKDDGPMPDPERHYFLYSTLFLGSEIFPHSALEYPGDRFIWSVSYTPDNDAWNVTFKLVAINPTPQLGPPQQIPSAPIANSSPTACQTAPPQPSSMFNCINGSWVSNGSISVPTISIPPNGDVLIFGNLSTGSVVFGGLSSSLIVKGCITFNLSTVLVELTQEDIDKLEKSKDKKITTLLLTSDPETTCENGVNLNNVGLKISSKAKSSCKKVKAEKAKNGNSKTFGAVFTLDSSKCNLWWIILLSVIGGLLIIGVIIVVLLVLFVPSVRYAIRPYSKKRAPAST